jgi:hypothetical protein
MPLLDPSPSLRSRTLRAVAEGTPVTLTPAPGDARRRHHAGSGQTLPRLRRGFGGARALACPILSVSRKPALGASGRGHMGESSRARETKGGPLPWKGFLAVAVLLGFAVDFLDARTTAWRYFFPTDISIESVDALQPPFQLKELSYERGVGYTAVEWPGIFEITNNSSETVWVTGIEVGWREVDDPGVGRGVLVQAGQPSTVQVYPDIGQLMMVRHAETHQRRDELGSQYAAELPVHLDANSRLYVVAPLPYEVHVNDVHIPVRDEKLMRGLLAPFTGMRLLKDGDYACGPSQVRPVTVRTDSGDLTQELPLVVRVAGCRYRLPPEVVQFLDEKIEGMRKATPNPTESP